MSTNIRPHCEHEGCNDYGCKVYGRGVLGSKFFTVCFAHLNICSNCGIHTANYDHLIKCQSKQLLKHVCDSDNLAELRTIANLLDTNLDKIVPAVDTYRDAIIVSIGRILLSARNYANLLGVVCDFVKAKPVMKTPLSPDLQYRVDVCSNLLAHVQKIGATQNYVSTFKGVHFSPACDTFAAASKGLINSSTGEPIGQYVVGNPVYMPGDDPGFMWIGPMGVPEFITVTLLNKLKNQK